MRTIAKLSLLSCALCVQLTIASTAHAAEILDRTFLNSTFATAASNPMGGPSQAVFVNRTVGDAGGPVTWLGFYYNAPDGCFIGANGYIPNRYFQVSANSASLKVDTSTLPAGTIQAFVSTCGLEPPLGVISVTWTLTGAHRESGVNSFVSGPITVRFAGTSVTTVATISGSIFGIGLVDPYAISQITSYHMMNMVIGFKN